MPGKQERVRVEGELLQTTLLGRLPEGSGLERIVTGFEVPTGLQPATQPRVQSQQDLTGVGRTDQGAGGQMGPGCRAGPALDPAVQVIEKFPLQALLLGPWR